MTTTTAHAQEVPDGYTRAPTPGCHQPGKRNRGDRCACGHSGCRQASQCLAAGELLAEDGRSAVGTAHARSRRNEATHEGSQRPPLELLPLSGVHGR